MKKKNVDYKACDEVHVVRIIGDFLRNKPEKNTHGDGYKFLLPQLNVPCTNTFLFLWNRNAFKNLVKSPKR